MQLECQVCGRAPANVECPGCHAMFYCSEKHMRRHVTLGHGEECARMSGQMSRAQELQAFPFAWARQLAAAVPGGGDTAVCNFLKSLNIHGLPLWSRECCCEDFKPFDSLGPKATSSCWGHFLSFLANTLEPSQGGANSVISDWREYYRARGLPDDHPAALILSTVTTLYHAVVWSWRQQHKFSGPPRSLNLHVLGAAKEVDQTPLFLELAKLLPGCQISLQLIGPSVPAGLPTQRLAAVSAGSLDVDVSYHHGLYHEVLPNLHKCIDLIFAPNAGLAAYLSWVDTLEALPVGVPVVITDYCEEAALRAAAMATAISGRSLAKEVSVNPFRRPASSCGSDSALPSYSNGFIFGLG